MEFDARRNPIGTGVASIAAPPADLGERPRTTVDATLRPGPGHRYRTLVWGPGEAHLVLTSHGRVVEIGAFLAENEREALERELKRALAALKAPGEAHTDTERR